MKNIAIGADGDLLKQAGNFPKVIDSEAFAQNINSYLQTNKTEIYLDDEQGIAWVQIMVKKNIDLDFKIAILKQAILNRPFVETITKFETEYIGESHERKLIVTTEIKAGSDLFPATFVFPQES